MLLLMINVTMMTPAANRALSARFSAAALAMLRAALTALPILVILANRVSLTHPGTTTAGVLESKSSHPPPLNMYWNFFGARQNE
jgi:hypothetical protein